MQNGEQNGHNFNGPQLNNHNGNGPQLNNPHQNENGLLQLNNHNGNAPQPNNPNQNRLLQMNNSNEINFEGDSIRSASFGLPGEGPRHGEAMIETTRMLIKENERMTEKLKILIALQENKTRDKELNRKLKLKRAMIFPTAFLIGVGILSATIIHVHRPIQK